MTPENAIKELTDYFNCLPRGKNNKRIKAFKLGGEALKQILQIRAYAKELFLPLLPGETKD